MNNRIQPELDNTNDQVSKTSRVLGPFTTPNDIMQDLKNKEEQKA